MAGSAIANDDYITMYLQGSTQWDSLAHVGYDDKFYNDADKSTITAHGGAARNDIGKLNESFVTRGLLIDMVRYKGYEQDGHLPKDYPTGLTLDLHICRKNTRQAMKYRGFTAIERKSCPITVEDLDGCCQAQGIEVKSGDALCLRTGWAPYWYTLKTAEEKEEYFHAQPGMSVATAEWVLSERDLMHCS